MEPICPTRISRTWHKIISRIANRLGWAERTHRIPDELDCTDRIAPQPSRGSHEYFYTATSDGVLFVRADVLGFLADELDITIEPRRLTIAGRRTITEHRKHDKIIYLDQCPNLLLRILQLPVEIDPNRSTATLRGGILEVSLPKAFPQPKMLSGADTQWVA